MVSKDLEKDLQEYENRAEALPDEEAPLDENFLKFAREYDGEHRKKNGLRRILKTAAVFLVSLTVLGGITMEASEAFRAKIFDMVFHKDSGVISMDPSTQSKDEMIADMSGYWYPEYLPDGCELVASEDNSFMISFSFMPEDEEYQIDLCEYERTDFRCSIIWKSTPWKKSMWENIRHICSLTRRIRLFLWSGRRRTEF